MDTTGNLKLPYILPSQAQKHVTHNEALARLDAVVQLCVKSRSMTSPPSNPAEGDRYLVPSGASGAFALHQGKIAAWQDGAYIFLDANVGWLAWVEDENLLLAHDGTAFAPAYETPDQLAILGINATADTINKLAISSPATLFNHDGAGHQLKLNKALPADTASLLMQTGFSGRAEIGLAGNDDLRIKVSADGSSWHEAMVVDRNDGSVAFPNTMLGGGTPGGSAGQVQFNDGGAFGGTDVTWNGTSKRLGVNTANPAHSLHVEKLEADKLTAAFVMSGWGRGGPAPTDAHGVGLYLSLNVPTNRQFLMADTLSGSGVRFLGATIDGVVNFGAARADLQIGTPTNGAHIASAIANTQFSVSNHAGTANKVVAEIGGHLSQTGDLLRVSTYHFGTSGDALKVKADKTAIFGGPAQLASFTVATVPGASASGAGAMIFVSDESGGATPAFSDGANWRRVSDRAIVS